MFRKIKFKVFFFTMGLLIITVCVSSYYSVREMNQHILKEVTKRADVLGNNVAISGGHHLLAGDVIGLDNLVYKIKNSNEDVEYAAIIDTDNKIVAHRDLLKRGVTLSPSEEKAVNGPQGTSLLRRTGSATGSILEVTTPIVSMDKELGFAVIGINRSSLSTAQSQARMTALLVLVCLLLLGACGSFFMSSYLTRPIMELTSGVKELEKGELRVPLAVYSHDELGNLTQSFNEMMTMITSQRNQLTDYAHSLEESYIATVRVLAASIDARDAYTHGHSNRVSHLSSLIGREKDLSNKELEYLEIACLFHDIGKIKIPDSILRKEARLSNAEIRIMNQHVEYGIEILSKAQSLHKFIPAVRHHHEWYNGGGYPDGLAGEQIPLFASIISIADAYDAMTTERPYRKALSHTVAVKRIIQSSGTQFAPSLVSLFERVIVKRALLSNRENGEVLVT